MTVASSADVKDDSVATSASAVEESATVEPGDDESRSASEEDENAVPQVMVGPDGNIVLNPGRYVCF